MIIFFTGAIRGGRGNQPEYAYITDILNKYGTVLNQHVADPDLSQQGETKLSDGSIFEREIERLEKSEIVFAEVTTPSLGVGMLIGEALARGKRIVALYKGENTDALSAMIKGNPAISIETYTSIQDIRIICDNIFL